MSDITLTQTIESDMPLSEDIIKNTMREALNERFDKFKFYKKNPEKFRCRVKSKLLNPIVSLRGTLQSQIQGNKAKLMIDASTKTNLWFWVTLLLWLILCFPLLLLMFWIHSSQKKRSIEAFNSAFKQIEFQLGKV